MAMHTFTPTLRKVLEIAKMGVPVTPTQINDHIGKGNYASKHVLYLKLLGYDFDTNKDGRSVVSYTLTKVPDNHQELVDKASRKSNKIKTTKTKSVAKVLSLTKTEATKIRNKVAAEKTLKITAKKSVADIKAANLAKLKEVAERRSKVAKRVRAGDEVAETFGTSGEVATSFSVDTDWDLVDGINLSKLL